MTYQVLLFTREWVSWRQGPHLAKLSDDSNTGPGETIGMIYPGTWNHTSTFLSSLQPHSTPQSIPYPHFPALFTTHNSLTCKTHPPAFTHTIPSVWNVRWSFQTIKIFIFLWGSTQIPLSPQSLLFAFPSSLVDAFLSTHIILSLHWSPFLLGYKFSEGRSQVVLPSLPKGTQTDAWLPASVPTKSVPLFVSSKLQTWEAP